jgi:UDP-3-O-[3-hydroxymyristoyl] N-acetylglucosamine deacetylase/3-hydroxyacyl-[acyl-carrier-protein] dehydratase
VPHDKLNIAYTLDYDHPALRSQFVSLDIDPASFARDVAGARTFCIESEVQDIRQQGLGRGSDYKTTLVMSTKGVVQNTLRFPDECARHKVVDIVGDLSLLGYPVQGAIYAIKSGHTLNRALVQKIEAQRKKYTTSMPLPVLQEGQGGRVFNIDQIMKILPHRYPFLFVDRVIEIEPGKKGIGIKNVTINDGFFKGIFRRDR